MGDIHLLFTNLLFSLAVLYSESVANQESSSPAPSTKSEQLQTSDRTPNPKRDRATLLIDDDSNKENIPPFMTSLINADVTPRFVRALRQNATEMIIPPKVHPWITPECS